MEVVSSRVYRATPRLIYGLDAIASFAMGAMLLVAADSLAVLAGGSLPAAFFFGVGLFLLPWSAFNLAIARLPSPHSLLVQANIAGDVIWVGGTVVLLALAGSGLNTIGLVLVVAQGLVVGGVLTMKLLGSRALIV